MSIFEIHNQLHELNFQSLGFYDLQYINDEKITVYIDCFNASNFIYFNDRTNKQYFCFDNFETAIEHIKNYLNNN